MAVPGFTEIFVMRVKSAAFIVWRRLLQRVVAPAWFQASGRMWPLWVFACSPFKMASTI